MGSKKIKKKGSTCKNCGRSLKAYQIFHVPGLKFQYRPIIICQTCRDLIRFEEGV